MPWTAADADRHSSGLTDKQKRQWAHVANSALQRCLDSGGERSNCEGRAIRQANSVVSKTAWECRLMIAKLNEDQHIVMGYASVAEDTAGDSIIDLQGDSIDGEELDKTAHRFVSASSRFVKEMHQGQPIGEVVGSIVFTPDKQQALGIVPGQIPVGWWIEVKVHDDAVWQKVKDGTYKSFSIGGHGRRLAYAA